MYFYVDIFKILLSIEQHLLFIFAKEENAIYPVTLKT